MDEQEKGQDKTERQSEREREEGSNQKKISLPEVIIMVTLSGVGDLFGIISGFSIPIPVIGQALIFFSLGVAITIFLIIQGWLIMRKVNSWAFAIGSLGDIITGGSFPLQTPALLITIYTANNPKSVIGKAAELAKGKAGAAVGAGKTTGAAAPAQAE